MRGEAVRRVEFTHGSADLETGALQGLAADHLTTTELALLRFLALRPGATIERGTLLTEVFGYHDHSTTRAVDKAVSSLRAKIEPDPANPRSIVTVWGRGYKLAPAVPVDEVMP